MSLLTSKWWECQSVDLRVGAGDSRKGGDFNTGASPADDDDDLEPVSIYYIAVEQ